MPVFAHYWGIDEVGVFVVPAAMAILALRWAERRARKAADAVATEHGGPETVVEEATDVE